MDSLDHDILEVLRRDARTPYTEIADRLDVSEGTVRNRVEAMVESGAIERFTVSTRTGNVKAMIEVEVAVGVDTEALAGVLADWAEVDFVWIVSGDQDVVVVVDAADTRSVNDLVARARDRDEILNTKTRLILDEQMG